MSDVKIANFQLIPQEVLVGQVGELIITSHRVTIDENTFYTNQISSCRVVAEEKTDENDPEYKQKKGIGCSIMIVCIILGSLIGATAISEPLGIIIGIFGGVIGFFVYAYAKPRKYNEYKVQIGMPHGEIPIYISRSESESSKILVFINQALGMRA
ncbi:MAG: hypothetical protein OEM52_03305 [bacterium]|nr:hypothetical protein [bacterium]